MAPHSIPSSPTAASSPAASVKNSILSPDVRVNSYSEVDDCILFSHVAIGRHCRIRNAHHRPQRPPPRRHHRRLRRRSRPLRATSSPIAALPLLPATTRCSRIPSPLIISPASDAGPASRCVLPANPVFLPPRESRIQTFAAIYLIIRLTVPVRESIILAIGLHRRCLAVCRQRKAHSLSQPPRPRLPSPVDRETKLKEQEPKISFYKERIQ